MSLYLKSIKQAKKALTKNPKTVRFTVDLGSRKRKPKPKKHRRDTAAKPKTTEEEEKM